MHTTSPSLRSGGTAPANLGTPPATDEVVPAYTSWWTGPVVEVPVVLREGGSRAQRGRTSAVEDHSAHQELLRARPVSGQRLERRRQTNCVVRLGGSPRLPLVPAALGLFLELLAIALGNAQLSSPVGPDGQGGVRRPWLHQFKRLPDRLRDTGLHLARLQHHLLETTPNPVVKSSDSLSQFIGLHALCALRLPNLSRQGRDGPSEVDPRSTGAARVGQSHMMISSCTVSG
ncbi:DUF2397 family protein [Streptomyces sp. NPDC088788]|uniref:DUF2397 family protein n=1 Tax=Streptomyces sp. NPDC088788 TaxID=3365898 RepID=UPI00380B7D09